MKLEVLIPCAVLFAGMLQLAAASGDEKRLLPLSLQDQPPGRLFAQTSEKPTEAITKESFKKERDSAKAEREKESNIDKQRQAAEKQADMAKKERSAAKEYERQATKGPSGAEKARESQSTSSMKENPSKKIQEKDGPHRDEKVILPPTSGPRLIIPPINPYGPGGRTKHEPNSTPTSNDPHAPGNVIRRGPDPTPTSDDPHVPGGDSKHHANPSGSPGLE